MTRSLSNSRLIGGVPGTLSLLGLAFSVWAHVDAIFGRDPDRQLPGLWILQLLLSCLLTPLAVEAVRRRSLTCLVSCERWIQIVLGGLLAYYAIQFYVFLFWSVDHLTSARTWEMFSAGWILLFGVSAAYYRRRSAAAE